MKRIVRLNSITLLALGALSLFSVVPATASDGYFAHGYGTKSKGMAGAGVALSLDPMSGTVNPASLALYGSGYDLGAALFTPFRSYSVDGAPSGAPGTFGLGSGTVDSGNNAFGVPHFAFNKALDQKSSFNVMIYGNGGMNTTYPVSANGGAGTFYGGQAGVNLEQLFVSPGYARKVSTRTALGLSALLAYQRFEARGLSQFAGYVADGKADCLCDRGDDHSYGFGARLGVLHQVNNKLSVGAAYQTQLAMSRFTKYSDLFAGQGSFDIPPSLTAGMAWKTSSKSVIAFDVQQIWYSAVGAVANPLANLAAAAQTQNPSGLLGGNAGAGFGWRDMTVYKLGYQWDAAKDWTLRTGVSYGQQPIPSSEVLFNILAPGVQEWHLTLGGTKRMGKASEMSFAFMYSPSKTVRGANPLEAPGQQNIALQMHQFEAEASFGYKF